MQHFCKVCGIAGSFGFADPVAVKKMLGKLQHRGPDDSYSVRGRHFTLGACRLSILDPEGGRQPLANETQTVWAAQNGEIYNFPELQQQLIQKGHRFITKCDTEILVHYYEERGEKLVADLSGMFAFALWDEENERGLLVRDRVGKKPLYYIWRNSALYFASEIKALLALPFVSKQLNLPALHYYLSYKHIPSPMTIYQGIHCLPTAHSLIYHSKKAVIQQYDTLSFAPLSCQTDEAELVDQLEDALKIAIQRRLLSDVPIGFFLSGGIDSSLIVAIAATFSSSPLKTFTLAYAPDSTTNAKKQDRALAQKVAERYGTEHYEEVISKRDLIKNLVPILLAFDEPFAGVISTFFLARLIARHVKVALSGDGADETFGSYLSHRLALPIAATLKGKAIDYLPAWEQSLVNQIASADQPIWRYKLTAFQDSEKKSLYHPELKEKLSRLSTLEQLRTYFAQSTAQDPLNKVLEAEFRSQLPDQVLTFVDRLSMVHSLEVRCPYLDWDFLKIAAPIPGRLKIAHGSVKKILRCLAARYLPEEVVQRPKEGFVLPIYSWLASDLKPYLCHTLSPKLLKQSSLFDPQAVQLLLSRFLAGESQLSAKVWTLFSFQLFYQHTFLGGGRS